MEYKYQIRVNGVVIQRIRVQNELVDGMPCGKAQIAILDPTLGWMTIDDNDNLPLSGVTEFVVETRDANIPAADRRRLPNKGWERTTVACLIARLESTGVLK